MHVCPLLYISCILLLALVSSPTHAAAWKRMAPKSATKDNASAVLNELKETIKRQQAEIASLKKKKAPPASHGHGGDVDISEEELDSYLTKPFFSLAMQRIGWLALFLASLSLTAIIMNGFEHTLSRQIELAYFVPLLAGHGGNTGGQSVGTVLSALSAGSIHVKDAPKVIGKEAMSGLVMGTILGIVVGPIAHYGMGISEPVATVIALTLPFVSAIAAFLGSAIPFTAIWLHLDPSVISGPAMTSFVDVCGLMSYFLIANSIFNMFGLEL